MTTFVTRTSMTSSPGWVCTETLTCPATMVARAMFAMAASAVAVVLIRTATFKPPAVADTASVKIAPAVTVDVAAAAQHLSQAVQIQTVSHQDLADDQPAEWTKLHDFLQAA